MGPKMPRAAYVEDCDEEGLPVRSHGRSVHAKTSSHKSSFSKEMKSQSDVDDSAYSENSSPVLGSFKGRPPSPPPPPPKRDEKVKAPPTADRDDSGYSGSGYSRYSSQGVPPPADRDDSGYSGSGYTRYSSQGVPPPADHDDSGYSGSGYTRYSSQGVPPPNIRPQLSPRNTQPPPPHRNATFPAPLGVIMPSVNYPSYYGILPNTITPVYAPAAYPPTTPAPLVYSSSTVRPQSYYGQTGITSYAYNDRPPLARSAFYEAPPSHQSPMPYPPTPTFPPLRPPPSSYMKYPPQSAPPSAPQSSLARSLADRFEIADTTPRKSRSAVDQTTADLILNETLPPSVMSLLRFLSLFESRDIPKSLLERACNYRALWTPSGELEYMSPKTALVPAWLLLPFDDTRKLTSRELTVSSALPQCLTMALERGLIETSGTELSECYNVYEPWRRKLRRESPAIEIIQALFDILSVVVQAFPEPYTEVLWEEMEFQYWELIQSTCLPFLGILQVDDVLEYLNSTLKSVPVSESRTLGELYLSCLLRFLLHILVLSNGEVPPTIHTLIKWILQFLQDSRHFPDFEHKYLRLSVMIGNAIVKPRPDLHLRVIYLEEIGDVRDARSNATLGFAIASFPESIKLNASQMGGKDEEDEDMEDQALDWSPIWKENPSSMEILVLSKLTERTLLENALKSRDSLSLDTKILCAFHAAGQQDFKLAREILGQALMKIKKTYGPASPEFIISGTELVNCCNILDASGEGESWARLIWSKAIDAVKPIDQEPPITSTLRVNLLIALADSYIGQANYDGARKLLLHVLRAPIASRTAILATALRLLKISRRQRKKASEFDVWDIVKTSMAKFDDIPQVFKFEFLEEALCVLSDIDEADNVQVLNAQLLIDTLGTYDFNDRLASIISHETKEHHLQTLRSYKQTLGLLPYPESPLSQQDSTGSADDIDSKNSHSTVYVRRSKSMEALTGKPPLPLLHKHPRDSVLPTITKKSDLSPSDHGRDNAKIRLEEPSSRQKRYSVYSASHSDYEKRIREAAAYQENATDPPISLTAEELAIGYRTSASSRETRVSSISEEGRDRGSRASSISSVYNQSGGEDVTIRFKGRAVVNIAGTKITYRDGDKVNIRHLAQHGSGTESLPSEVPSVPSSNQRRGSNIGTGYRELAQG